MRVDFRQKLGRQYNVPCILYVHVQYAEYVDDIL